jgi:hypothetical protein
MGMLLRRHREERAGNETTAEQVEPKPAKKAADKKSEADKSKE